MQKTLLISSLVISIAIVLAGCTRIHPSSSPVPSPNAQEKVLSKDDNEQQAYDQIDGLLKQKVYKDKLLEAETIAEDIIKIHPSAKAYTKLSIVESWLGYVNNNETIPERIALANQDDDKALSLDPQYFLAYREKISLISLQKNDKLEKEWITKARQVPHSQVENEDLDLVEVEIALRAGDLRKAQTILGHVSQETTDQGIKDVMQGEYKKIYIIQGNYDLADQIWRDEIANCDVKPWCEIDYAQFLIDPMHKYDDAIAMAKNALAGFDFGVGHKVLSDAYVGKAGSLARQGKYDEAKTYLNLALQENPQNLDVQTLKILFPGLRRF